MVTYGDLLTEPPYIVRHFLDPTATEHQQTSTLQPSIQHSERPITLSILYVIRRLAKDAKPTVQSRVACAQPLPRKQIPYPHLNPVLSTSISSDTCIICRHIIMHNTIQSPPSDAPSADSPSVPVNMHLPKHSPNTLPVPDTNTPSHNPIPIITKPISPYHVLIDPRSQITHTNPPKSTLRITHARLQTNILSAEQAKPRPNPPVWPCGQAPARSMYVCRAVSSLMYCTKLC